MTNYERHIIAAVLTAVSVYLKAPYMLLAPVLVYVIGSIESVLKKASRDAEILAILARVEGYEKRVKILETDVVNVADRAKLILGENF